MTTLTKGVSILSTYVSISDLLTWFWFKHFIFCPKINNGSQILYNIYV